MTEDSPTPDSTRSQPATSVVAPAPQHNFAFVLNVGSLVGQQAFELAPGHVLRRATPEEVETIRGALSRILSIHTQPLGLLLWEAAWPLVGGAIVPLPLEEWRYFVIAFTRFNDTLNRIQEALDLADIELEVGFTMHGPGGGFSFYPARFFHVLEDVAPDGTGFFHDVTQSHVQAVGALCNRLLAHNHSVLDLRPLITQIRALKALQHQSALRFLGYFAVLEALITHAPLPSDPYDSITRQVKKKLALLNNRWASPLDYSAFGGTSPEKVWSAMYTYRSRIAHGAIADFKDSDLRVLGNRENSLQLLTATVKAAMRHALKEPALIRDLREC